MNNKTASTLFLAMLVSLAGCQVLYDTKVADTESGCEKLVSQTQVQECKQKVRAQLADYRREQSDKNRSQSKAERDSLCFTKQATGEKVCPN
jgi:hypothetical protein